MPGIIKEEYKKIINDQATVKAVASIDKNGIPHVVFKGSLKVQEDGKLVFYEILESSRNNQNFVHSIWFDKYVAVNALSCQRESIEIIGKPVKSITSGRIFEKAYLELQERSADLELGAIWIIEPKEVRNENLSVRRQEQEEKYPILQHEDHLLKEDLQKA